MHVLIYAIFGTRIGLNYRTCFVIHAEFKMHAHKMDVINNFFLSQNRKYILIYIE